MQNKLEIIESLKELFIKYGYEQLRKDCIIVDTIEFITNFVGEFSSSHNIDSIVTLDTKLIRVNKLLKEDKLEITELNALEDIKSQEIKDISVSH